METKPKSELSILLVEDYEMDRTAVQTLLLDAGYDPSRIHTTSNTLDTQTFIDASPPDILILDLEIPVDANTPLRRQDDDIRRGLNFLRTLTERYNDGLHIIVLSRFPKPWSVFQVLACGVSFIDKSNYKDLLLLAVEQAQRGHVIISSNVRPNLRQIFPLAVFQFDRNGAVRPSGAQFLRLAALIPRATKAGFETLRQKTENVEYRRFPAAVRPEKDRQWRDVLQHNVTQRAEILDLQVFDVRVRMGELFFHVQLLCMQGK
jgi:DNA-binding NarL/FixJ family response regulator